MRTQGRLRQAVLLRELHGVVLYAGSRLPGQPLERRLERLVIAARRTDWPWLRRRLRRRLEPHLTGRPAAIWRARRIAMSKYYGEFGGFDGKPVAATIVVKAPGANGEKGVLYSSFEYNWVRLLDRPDAARLLDEFQLVGASSWSPPDYGAMAHFAGLSREPVLLGVSHPADVEAYRLLEPIVEPLPIMACDWIDPSLYRPRPHASRSIDILMVANWLPFKRHWLLFEALRHMAPQLRVVLVGRSAPDRTAETIRAEARAFGVRQDLELRSDVTIEEVRTLQADARISVLFSRREGSCVAVVESLFADAPVALMREAHVGSKAYVNGETGILVTRRGLARQLSAFLERAATFGARRWAEANVSCHTSSARLNGILRALAARHGRPWTRDIAPLCWRPMPAHVHDADRRRFGDCADSLQRQFGISLAER